VTKRVVLNKYQRSLVDALKAHSNEPLPEAAIPPLMVKRLPVQTALFRLTGMPITYQRLWDAIKHNDDFKVSITIRNRLCQADLR
jgi:hypothetical protein